MTRPPETIAALLMFGADEAVAISAPGRLPLTYQALRSLVAEVAGLLTARGLTVGDRVAIVLDNGPEMAAAFLAIGSVAVAAPLNPGYRAEEFEFYLNDLGASLVVVAEGKVSAATEVADRLGIAVATLFPRTDRGAGEFDLVTSWRASGSVPPGKPTANDVALCLHTSGTTSRPKMVPLTHRNLCASASNIRESLGLTSDDRGLVIMPLFHIHGLIAALLAPLVSGGEVVCTSGFNALKFFGWLNGAQPTWYTGVPTMHQAILLRAGGNREALARHRLRFIRSSSSSLPTRVMGELESMFGVPVIEAYGMTEAAHQMASNPLPPGRRKAGTVGVPAGPELRIVDEQGTSVALGEVGEITIRGSNVMAAYQNNAAANESAFFGEWFRTGDQGMMDGDGYHTITGRLKEIINRGGEKVSPREVDEIMMEHPAVHQCVTFAMPHDLLGEEVAAAIVLKEGAEVKEHELREFARRRLADFKIPRTFVLVAAIPVGPTGKLQRIGLAKQLGLG